MNDRSKKIGIFEILRIAFPKCTKATPLLFGLLLVVEGLFAIISVIFVRIQQCFFDKVTYAITNKGFIKEKMGKCR